MVTFKTVAGDVEDEGDADVAEEKRRTSSRKKLASAHRVR